MTLPASEIALQHQLVRERTASTASVRALRLWRQIDPQKLDTGWDFIAPQMTALVSQAQVAAALQSTPYMNAVDRYYGTEGSAQVVPEAFGGITLDGRELGPAMFSAVTTTKEYTPALGAARAFEVGASMLATIVGAAVQDMGRQADNTLSVGRTRTRYVRVCNPGACSRCAILSGKASLAVPFKRHPRCRCTAWPIPAGASAKTPTGLFDSAEAYFDSLSKVEQDRVFTKAGAEAIRQGADPIAVVNARRGALTYRAPDVKGHLYPTTIGIRSDGSPLRVYLTHEATTARGSFGKQELRLTAQYTKEGRYRRTTTVRLMPEQIAVMAGGNHTRWVELLRKYGYLY